LDRNGAAVPPRRRFAVRARDLLQLDALAVMPDIDDVTGPNHVSLLVETKLPQHGREFIVVERLRQRLDLDRTGLRRGLGEDLHRGIGEQRVALGLIAVLAELGDHGLRLGEIAWLRREGHEVAFARGPGNAPIFIRRQRVAADLYGVQSLFLRLPRDQAGLGVIAAIEIADDAGLLHLADQRRKILVAGIDRFVQRFLHARRVERLARLVGEAFAVGRFVVDDRDRLALEMRGEIIAGDLTLLVVAAADAEYVDPALFQGVVGEGGIGRCRRDLQDSAVGIDRRGRDRRTRAEMPVDKDHALVGELVCDVAGLFRVAGVVTDRQHQFLAKDAAFAVDIGDRQFGATFHLLANG